MRNFIKYSKLKLRDRPDSCSPVGPNFESAGTQKVSLADTLLEFKAPRHDPSPYGETPQLRMRKEYSLNDNGKWINSNILPSESWRHTEVFFRQWSFCGPWFTGHMGEVSCYFEVIQLTNPSPQVNFLHPQALESAALAYLTANYGYEIYDEDSGKMHYIGPLNWSAVSQLEISALQFDHEKTYAGAIPHRHVFFPVSHSHIAHFSFDMHQSASGTREQVDQQIDPAPFKELVDNIVGSIRVTLSPDAQASWNEIKQQNPEAKISDTCAPLKWPADVDKDGLTILDYDPKRYA